MQTFLNAPLVEVAGPTPQPAGFGLYSVAPIIDAGDTGVREGVRWLDNISGSTASFAVVANNRTALAADGAPPWVEVPAFGVSAGIGVDHPLGLGVEELRALVRTRLALQESQSVEAAYWTGKDSHGTATGSASLAGTTSRALTDVATTASSTTISSATGFTSADRGAAVTGGSIPAGAIITSVPSATTAVLSAAPTATAAAVSVTVARPNAGVLNPTPGAAVSFAQGLGLLEQWVGSANGAVGIIHAPRTVLGTMTGLHVRSDGGKLRTLVGTLVAAGTGYTGCGPSGAAPATGTTWLYATGPAQVLRSPVLDLPADPRLAVDRSSDATKILAERYVAVGHDVGAAAVLVNLA